MPLQLPNLDDRTYADLMEEARRLIPTYAPEWTNHNPSDPGVTFVELFAYLSEILLYRLNRVTEANQLKFLKLLQGRPDEWVPSGDLDADTRATVQRVRTQFRAVTAADYERLALKDFNQLRAAMKRAEAAGESLQEWWTVTGLDPTQEGNLPSKLPVVQRARCVPVRNLDRGTEKERSQAEAGHVSLIVIPAQDPDDLKENPSLPPLDAFHPDKAFRQAVWGFLDERRILTTRHHVVGTSFAPITADLVIARTDDIARTENAEADLLLSVRQKLADFLDPLSGGASQEGWPFGRDVYVSEICEQLEAIPGIDYVTDVMLSSEDTGGDDRCVPASQIWHSEGDLVGLKLSQHHLPMAPLEDIEAARIVIVPHSRIVPVRVTVTLENATGDLAPLKQKLKGAIRKFFHPQLDGPGAEDTTEAEPRIEDLLDILQQLADPISLSLELDVDSAHALMESGELKGIHVNAGEIINWSVVVKLSVSQ